MSPPPTSPDAREPLGLAPEGPANVGAWPARHAARDGARLAVVDRDRRLDRRAFENRIAASAGWLHTAGVDRGDRVALLLGNRSAMLELALAAARIGAIIVPINLRLSAREIAFQLDDCTPKAFFHEADLSDVADGACAQAAHTLGERMVVGGTPDAWEACLPDASKCHDAVDVSPDDPFMIMYTSGTTGQPKGALLPHRKALYNAKNAEITFSLDEDDRVLVAAPLFHSLGLQILALPALHAGATVILHDRFDAARVWHDVEAEQISYLGGVPAMHQRLHDELVRSDTARRAAAGLRFLFSAGSAIAVELIRAFHALGVLVKQGYGQTETSTLTCLDDADALRKAGSVGRPVRHGEVRVVRLDDLEGPPADWRDADDDVRGEIVVHGPITMLGYWGRPDETAKTIIDGWVRTGDLASRDEEGFITLVGRARDMYISGGENVYPAEVEAVYREHPSIEEIAVVGVPDERWGEVGRAHVVLRADARLDAEALRAWATDRLAAFKIPRTFVATLELPRTASGKVQKHRLAQGEA